MKQQLSVSNPKVWIVIGVSVAGVLILTAEARLKGVPKDYGAFMDRFQLPPPAAYKQPQPQPQPLSGLTFAINDVFDVKEYVTGFGNPDWKRTHEEAERTAVISHKDIFKYNYDFRITGENSHYGTPTNPKTPSCIPGGSCSGSAVAVAAELVDFAPRYIRLCISFLSSSERSSIAITFVDENIYMWNIYNWGSENSRLILWRPRFPAFTRVISTIGVLPNSQSLDTVGIFARDPSLLHQVGHVILQLNSVEPRRTRNIIVADDLFQLSKVTQQKTVYIISKVTEKLSGYQAPKHTNIGEYIFSNVPSLNYFLEQTTKLQNGASILKALSSVMLSLQRYEFKTNHEEWVNTFKRRLLSDVSDSVHETFTATHENIKAYYMVRTEMRTALHILLKDDEILVIPTVADNPPKLNSKKALLSEFNDQTFPLLSIATMSGCCQVTVPLGKHEDCPISVSFIANHGSDKFLLDTMLEMYQSLQGQVGEITRDASRFLKEKGNAAYKGKQWQKAITYYTEAVKLDEINATFYCNRAAAYLELGSFQQAEEDCTKALSLDKKNVKAYLRRGTARESVHRYKPALKDFVQALVLEPQNKTAKEAVKRLQKLIT
ncbi:outer envelope protein 64, mitochondrial-like [Bidens hawaiensis]|uniref:outer envelope protein 64, mitochondrial-like n=1 Tax=Bidens hawaiensis TaxID=980011 RepID=UPI004049C4EF